MQDMNVLFRSDSNMTHGMCRRNQERFVCLFMFPLDYFSCNEDA